MPLIHLAVLAAIVACVIVLIVMLMKSMKFPRQSRFARAQGDIKRGIIYAFGKGMTPWEKESAGKHLPTYLTGITYHAGIFITLLYLLMSVFSISMPDPFLWLFRLFSLLGLIAGIGLLFKRLFIPNLRGISAPDDFIANLLVDVFLLSGFLATLQPQFISPFMIAAILLFLYIPLGKIRHCAFFFVVRIQFGAFYGRRGVFPKTR